MKPNPDADSSASAWTLYHLLQQDEQVANFDIREERQRLDLLITGEIQAGIAFVQGDLTNLEHLTESIQEYQITQLILFAALQVQFCKANPPLGAQMDVIGTVNVLKRLADRSASRRLCFVD